MIILEERSRIRNEEMAVGPLVQQEKRRTLMQMQAKLLTLNGRTNLLEKN